MNNKTEVAPKKSLLYNKKAMAVLSALLALLFWVVITITQNPTRDITIDDVPITINTEGTVISELGLGIVGEYKDQATVRVSGPSYIVSGLKSGDITVTASLADVKSAGTYELELTASRGSTTSGYSILSVKPSKIRVSFDAFDTNSFNIVPVANGVSAVNGLVAESAIITDSEQSAIIVTGPHSEMEKISTVKAIADVNKTLSETTSYDAELAFFDKDDNKLDLKNLKYTDEKIQITVPISRKKEVKIVPTFVDKPEYYNRKNVPYKLSEEKLTVIGPPETVDKLETVELESIDFSEITDSSQSFDVPLNLPNGVKSVENIEYITVKVPIKNLGRKTLTVKNISASNLQSGLRAELANDVKITLCGDKSALRKIKSQNVVLTVDALDKKKGDYTLDAKVSINKANNVWAIGSYQVTVSIK